MAYRIITIDPLLNEARATEMPRSCLLSERSSGKSSQLYRDRATRGITRVPSIASAQLYGKKARYAMAGECDRHARGAKINRMEYPNSPIANFTDGYTFVGGGLSRAGECP